MKENNTETNVYVYICTLLNNLLFNLMINKFIAIVYSNEMNFLGSSLNLIKIFVQNPMNWCLTNNNGDRNNYQNKKN